MASWRTTLGGLLLAAGTGMTAGTGTMHFIGVIVSAVGALILGGNARDHVVSSEQAGLKGPPAA